jgi:nitrogenase molybdenum-iron protein alpha/beta subunit
LKAKARKDRWNEELVLIQCEMNWTERFFHFMGQKWDRLGAEELGREETSHAHRTVYERSLAAYAAKQAAMWKRMEERANAAFSTVRIKYGMQ